jgi:hypothetical protein
MPKNLMKATILIAGVAGIMVVAFGAGSTVSPSVVKQKTVLKKNVKKTKTDTVPAISWVGQQDSSKMVADSLAPKLFSFRVVTEPESASVLLDDSLKGVSPCSLSAVAPGNHALTLKKTGYYLKKAEITVDSASPPMLSFVLLKPAFLSVISDPSGAVLSIDGKNEGITPYVNDKVKPGDHTLKVEFKQYLATEQTVSIVNGGCDTIRFTLEHTAAYKDSVQAAQQAKKKLRKDRFTFSVVSAIFCVCAILLVVVEANNQ